MTNIRFEAVPIRENREPMVEASVYGFFAEPMYFQWGHTKSRHLFLREGLARILKDIEMRTLRAHGLRFKIWDPWRPRSLQGALYDEFYQRLKKEHPGWDDAQLKNETGIYVTPADTKRIPPHATGGTLDLTLCDAEGRDVDMGTGFDHFGPEAALDYFEKPGSDVTIRDNRRLLKNSLLEAGLNADSDEWWHYDYGNQKWALALGRDHAFYGEVEGCVLNADKTVMCSFLQA